jgi:hypothetical protein
MSPVPNTCGWRAIAQLESDDAGRAHHESHRIGVAQIVGRLTTVHFGLWGVPAHVR